MVSSFLLKLAMVVLTMAIVCWIGWTIPASRDIETLHAQGPVESDPTPLASVPPTTSRTPLTPHSRRQAKELSRDSAPTTVDLNLATEQDLERLPGIGPVLARRIVQYRQMQGTFQAVQQLRQVKGIGKKTFERIRDLVAVMPPAATTPVRKIA
ncbi:MAG TPA: helix-hairpin-helix domain-containing protein [Nitrospira sp.]|nr:helix-hairpin-helix domain-containing protein [Nitrospira sp.]